jgi:hypothetical protein
VEAVAVSSGDEAFVVSFLFSIALSSLSYILTTNILYYMYNT